MGSSRGVYVSERVRLRENGGVKGYGGERGEGLRLVGVDKIGREIERERR